MRQSWRGFSLVELMVSLVLGMVLLTGVGHLFLSTNKTYTLQDELIRMQESARVVLDLLKKDIRMAAYSGCPSWSDMGNALMTTETNRVWMTHVDKGVLGIPMGSEAESIIDSHSLSEVLVIHKIEREASIPVLSQNRANYEMTLIESHDLNQGDLLALIDETCEQVSVFIAGSGTSGSKVSYAFSNRGALYNCTGLLRGAFNCMDGQSGTGVFDISDSELAPLSSVAYYIRESNGVPTFYRRRAGETAGGSRLSAEALVEGIEGFYLLYGVDTDGDGVVNQYRPASSIGLYSSDWKTVISVKVELLIRSLREEATEPVTYFFQGAERTATDHYLRKVFVTSVELRNRDK